MNDSNRVYEVLHRGSITLRSVEDRALGERLKKKRADIQRIWDEENRKSGGMYYNEKTLVFSRIEKEHEHLTVYGCYVGYRNYLAQQRNPDLGLGIAPVGVSGIVIVGESGSGPVVFARRAENTSTYPGCYELVPAGNIDTQFCDEAGNIDYRSMLMTEFEEEVGKKARDYITEVTDFALIFDRRKNIYDICCRIVFAGGRDIIEESIGRSDEYMNAVFVPPAEIPEFLEANKNRIVPTTVGLAELYFEESVV